MVINQHLLINNKWTDSKSNSAIPADKVQLVLVFAGTNCIQNPDAFAHLKELYPIADIVFTSTSGEIYDQSVFDNSMVATAMYFDKTCLKAISLPIAPGQSSHELGIQLFSLLQAPELAHVLVISDGMVVNGSELVDGFNLNNKMHIPITGGLAGDGDRFKQTFTGLNQIPSEGNVTAVGFYGSHIKIGHGSMGGWDEFGPERTITKSDKNVLFEIDGKNALSLYKDYLGDYANELPGSALLFPLSLKRVKESTAVVRTILTINEADQSMVFAGNMPENGKVRLMKANFDRLIEGSLYSAENALKTAEQVAPDFCLLISCVGRKLVLQKRVEEEIDAVREILGNKVPFAGFYSYGEISPFSKGSHCELHNQTMTITTFTEL